MILWLFLQPVIECPVDLFRSTVLRYRFRIIDTVNKTQCKCFIGFQPMVGIIKVTRPDFFLTDTLFRGIHLTQGIFQSLHFFQTPAKLRFVSVATAGNTMQHETGIFAHFDRLAA